MGLVPVINSVTLYGVMQAPPRPDEDSAEVSRTAAGERPIRIR